MSWILDPRIPTFWNSVNYIIIIIFFYEIKVAKLTTSLRLPLMNVLMNLWLRILPINITKNVFHHIMCLECKKNSCTYLIFFIIILVHKSDGVMNVLQPDILMTVGQGLPHAVVEHFIYKLQRRES